MVAAFTIQKSNAVSVCYLWTLLETGGDTEHDVHKSDDSACVHFPHAQETATHEHDSKNDNISVPNVSSAPAAMQGRQCISMHGCMAVTFGFACCLGC